ncbi:M48 family metalloprotease [Allosaccharopolyspora coralli]|uniref:M48 family metalloprotease n=1 Tax=Allosaccharopolyspora coralli TaxID=2665642 RepID=A0A5Q3QFC7_9PSEU|nr:M56 family metallopeptidase [Allosaccharopolyspora coralli]QGK70235.1 M48 family metalloprotease [Allosaccharopolyspora coralli]
MILATCLAFYGFLVAVVAPRFLPRLTAAGTAPRFGAAVWTLTAATAVGAWIGAAVAALFSLASWPGRVADVLRSCLAALRPLGITAPWVAALLAVPAVLVSVWLGWLMWRAARHWVHAHVHGKRHSRAIRLAGREAPELGAGTIVIETADVAAYCVASPTRTVVVTRGALDALDRDELAAVLAHEHAHLRGRHHLLLTALRAMRRALPGALLFQVAEVEVARLLELCADDAAVKRHGTLPLVAALASMTSNPAPRGALGAAGASALARALRLAEPPSRSQSTIRRAALGATATGMILGPGLGLVAMGVTICPVFFQ